MATPLLALNRVTRQFHGAGTMALAGVDLAIHVGDFICIHGASGSGKSTLLNILGCLDRPTNGRVLIEGHDVWSLSTAKVHDLRRATFGFIFQNYALIPALDVRQNVELPAVYARRATAEMRRASALLVERLGLSHRATQMPNLLSGGEQQRVAIARALINRPRVILADEPTGALDSVNSRQVVETIRGLHRDGHTVVLVTHDRAIAAMANRIVTLRDGQIEHDTATSGQSAGDAAPAALRIVQPRPAHAAGRDRWQVLKSAITIGLTSLARNKIQSGLTILGIMIGIGSVFAMLTVGTAANRQVIRNIESLGADLLTISRGPPGVRGAERTVVTLTPPDLDIARTTAGVVRVTPEMDGVVLARHQDRDFLVTASGTDENFPDVRDWPVVTGSFFSNVHLRQHAAVVVLGATARENLFPGIDPVGRYMLIGRSPFLVLGVMARKGVTTGPGHDRDNQIWLPYTTAGSRLFGRVFLDRIVAKTQPGASADAVMQALRRAIMARHGAEDFSVLSLAEVVKVARKSQDTLNLLLTAIAILALIIAGVGVMNMMLSSVSDRVSEIGIRMAVGASRGDIRSQFLVESVVLCAVGGLAGALLGLAASMAAGAAMGLKIELAWQPIALAMGCAVLVGVGSGALPAMRASEIQPSIAIKQE